MSRKTTTSQNQTNILQNYQTGQNAMKAEKDQIKIYQRQVKANIDDKKVVGNILAEIAKFFNEREEIHDSYALRGTIYNIMGNYQRALYDFTVAIRIAQSSGDKDVTNKLIAEYINMAGVQHQELGNLQEALQHFKEAIDKDKENGCYYYNRGCVQSRMGQLEKAIQDYGKALEYLSEEEQKFQALFNRGICYRNLGPQFLELSINDLKSAADKKTDIPSVHNNLGLSYFEKGMYEEALVYYQKAISLEETAVHLNNRGLTFYHINRLEPAKNDFDKAIELNSNDPVIFFNRGNMFLNWEPKNYVMAHRDYDRALRIDPNNSKLYHAKGLAFEI